MICEQQVSFFFVANTTRTEEKNLASRNAGGSSLCWKTQLSNCDIQAPILPTLHFLTWKWWGCSLLHQVNAKKCEFEKSKAEENLTTEHLGDMFYPDALFS